MYKYCNINSNICSLSESLFLADDTDFAQIEELVTNEENRLNNIFNILLKSVLKHGTSYLCVDGPYLRLITKSAKYINCVQVTHMVRHSGKIYTHSHYHIHENEYNIIWRKSALYNCDVYMMY